MSSKHAHGKRGHGAGNEHILIILRAAQKVTFIDSQIIKVALASGKLPPEYGLNDLSTRHL
jgi:hypothetical protein